MKVVDHPKLTELFTRLDMLWHNRRMAGPHKQDVEDILMDIFCNNEPEATKYMCPVCDYNKMTFPPRNHEICPCCGTEFGYDDFDKSNQQLREEWIRGGGVWWSTAVPDNREG